VRNSTGKLQDFRSRRKLPFQQHAPPCGQGHIQPVFFGFKESGFDHFVMPLAKRDEVFLAVVESQPKRNYVVNLQPLRCAAKGAKWGASNGFALRLAPLASSPGLAVGPTQMLPITGLRTEPASGVRFS
jgi:hypothetical protein